MTSHEFFKELGYIDPKMIEAAAPGEKRTRRTAWIKWVSVAACVCLIAMAGAFAIRRVPSVSAVQGGDHITGQQMLVSGTQSVSGGFDADVYMPTFEIISVLEVEVIEVLDGVYYNPAWQWPANPCHVVRLRVVDEVHGAGFPDEIYLCYPYYDATVFDGYECFVTSLTQVGVENYALVNQTDGRVEYFPNMFEIPMTRDVGYGCVIAFNDGRVDAGFWDRVNRNDDAHSMINMMLAYDSVKGDFPAVRDSTLDEVKVNVQNMAEDKHAMGDMLHSGDFVTADNVFLTVQARAVQAYVQPDANNTFMHHISVREDRVIATYTRLINGFATDEIIWLNGYDGENGNVKKSGVVYTAEDITKAPDIGQAIARIELSRLKPPHTVVTKDMREDYVYAVGSYYKVLGKVYGTVHVMWRYSYTNVAHAYRYDDLYYMYHESGVGHKVSKLRLRMMGIDIPMQYYSFWDDLLFWN